MTFHFSHIGSKKPNFHLFNQNAPKGVDNLDPKLTINSVTETPVFRYKGGDADGTDWDHWGYGETLSVVGSGHTVNQGSPLLGPNDDSAAGNSGGWKTSSNDFGQITTEDFVFEMVYKHASESTKYLIGTFQTGNGGGWEYYIADTSVNFYINNGSTSFVSSSTVSSDAWYHIFIVGDRSGSMRLYVNGTAVDTDVISTIPETLQSVDNFTIGSKDDGTYASSSNVAYAALWKRDSWLDTHEQDSLATERFTKLTGFYPYTAEGTAIPTVYTRGSVGYLDNLTIGSTDVLTDGEMEYSGILNWAAVNSATVTKETTDPHSGIRNLKVAAGGSAYAAARQSTLTSGEYYKMTGWARGDGVESPSIWDETLSRKLWEGTSETGWQYFSVVFAARGTSLDLSVGNTTTGYVEFDDLEIVDIERNVYLVSDEWLRLIERIDDNGEVIHGYLAETTITNTFLHSSDFTAVWSGMHVSDSFEEGQTSTPNLETSGCVIQGSDTDTEHGASQTATITADTWCLSVFAKPSFEDFLYLSDYTVANADCYFDLTTGKIGTEGAGCTGYIEPWGNDWYRCGIVFTGTAAAHEFRIQPAAADGDLDYEGNGDQPDIYVWGAQLENNSYMSSYFPTGGSTATRDKDELRYKADDGNVTNNNENTIEYKMLIPDQTPLTRPVPVTLSDGGSTSDRILPYTNGSDVIDVYSLSEGGESGYILGTTNVSDGTFHEYKITCQKDNMHLFVDGVSEGIETLVHIASGLDRIDVGQSQSATKQPNGIVTDLKLYDYVDKDYGPTFQLFKGTGPEGVDALNPYMTVNGITETPVFRYKGGDADGTDWDRWDYGQNLDLESGTVPSYNQGSPLLGPNDDSVTFNAGGYYQSSGTSLGDITTEDIVAEIIFKTGSTKNRIIVDKEDTNPGYVGWRWTYQTGGEVSFRTYQASSVYTQSTALDSNTWYHAIVFINRDENSTNGSQMYINGIASGSGVDHSANSASLSNSVKLTIGANTGAAFQHDSTIAYTALWKSASWHKAGADGPTEWADIAAKRFAQLSGIYPFKAQGTALPTVQTRASAAYLDKIVYDTDILVDGDMEGSDTSDWTSVNSSTLSKESPGQFNRTQYLKIASSGTTWPSARQAVLTDGNYYKVTGYAKGDGNRSPSIWDDTLTRRIWIGTPSTEWQRFSAAFIARGTNIDFTAGATDTGYVGFDNVTLEPITKELYQVGDNWMRVVRRIDENGIEVKGYLSEEERINRVDYSEDFWSGRVLANASIVTNQTTAPNKESTADVLHEDDTEGTQHYLYDTTGSSAVSGLDVAYSVFTKAINRDWVCLAFNDAGAFTGATRTYFDIDTGVVGATDQNDESGIEPWGDGWFRCWIKREADDTATVVSMIFAAEDDNDTTFNGLDQDSIYLWGDQVEFDVPHPSSYIPVPSTSDITRSGDILRYKGDDGNITNNKQGSVLLDILSPNYTESGYPYIFAVTDGGSSADRIAAYLNPPLENVSLITRATGDNDGGANGDLETTDNVVHRFKGTWATNNLNMTIDGEDNTTDSDCGIPDNLDQIGIGVYNTSVQTNAVLSNFRLYDYPKKDYKSTFSLFSEGNFVGVDALDPNLTINGITEQPILRFKGGDANATDWNYWGYGENLDYQSGTAPDYNQGSPLLGPNDDSVKFNAGAYYQADNNSFADITTEDFVVELVFKWSTTNNIRMINKYGSSVGYVILENSNKIRITFGDGTTINVDSAALVNNTWYHAMLFINRDEASTNGSQWYVNGSSSGSGVDVSARVSSITKDGPFVIAGPQADQFYDSNIAYVAMWKRSSWHQAGASGPAEWTDVAAERFAKLTGIYPNCLGTALPTVQTRATVAYLDKLESGNRKLYQVGDNWMRICERSDSNDDYIKGYLAESEGINRADYSEDFSSGRTLQQLTVLTDQTYAPNKELTADILHEDDSDAISHYIYDLTGSSVASGLDVTYSVFVKPINRDWTALAFNNFGAFAGSTYTHFNLSNGTVGTDDNDSSGIEDWGDGWYRCWIRRSTDDTGDVVGIIYIGESDGDFTFSGLDQDSLYVWGEQIEFDSDYPSSYIPVPATSDVTRNKDSLRYKGDDGNVTNNQQGTIICDVLISDYDNTSSLTLITLTDNGSNNDRIIPLVHPTEVTTITTNATGGETGYVAGTTNISDEVIHRCKFTYRVNDINSYVDGNSEGTPDTLANVPNDLDRIDIGQSQSVTSQLNGVVSNIQIFDRIEE